MGPDNKRHLRSIDDLLLAVKEEGFLPLFRNGIDGFSVEDRTSPAGWWSGIDEIDPWEWRRLAARSAEVAYGKFFIGRAGFISTEWFPVFANWKRDGYDFDALFDDGKATIRQKKVMDLFMSGEEQFSFEAKRKAGFGKEGERNFEGTVTSLEKASYLVIRDFRRRVNKKGSEYGWHIAVLTAPESIWGYEMVTSDYAADPCDSRQRILDHVSGLYLTADEDDILAVLGN